MSDLTKAQLSARILEHIGVKSAADGARAEDDALVQEAIDAAHERLQKYGLVPFATSAIPPWAQLDLRDYVAGEIVQAFGLGGDPKWEAKASKAERELARQIAGFRHNLPIVTEYF